MAGVTPNDAYPMISIEEAMETVLQRVEPLSPVKVSLEDSAGRVLALDIRSREDVPATPTTSRDGFAIDAGGKSTRRRVVGEQLAGRPVPVEVSVDTAVRITTGAPIPPGADAVIMVEDTEEEGEWVTLLRRMAPGDNIRPPGQDIESESLVLPRGTLIGPPEIGLLATLGHTHPRIYPRPRVAVMATGDEVVDPADEPSPGQIRNSNGHALMAAVRQAGGVPLSMGIARDQEDDVLSKLRQGFKLADVVITSGGVSVGKRDLVKPQLEKMGRIHFGRVAVKPGKPFTFATVDGKAAFGLPGFPVSSLVTFELFVRPALLKMQGRSDLFRPTRQVILDHSVDHSPGRTEFQRAILEERQGGLYARTTGDQVSGRLLSLVGANALLRLPQGVESFQAGETVTAVVTGDIPVRGVE
jgi:molybdenum cofactor synthesis domain-containing protein